MAFNTLYQTPMDRGYYAEGNYWPDEEPKLEEPVIPINELGMTIVEKHPQTGANIVQNTQAAIRAGAGNVQIVLTTPSTSPIGGRPKAYGKEVREAIRELSKANEMIISGIELPTSSITNLSGFDPQRFTFSEEKRSQDMEEVRDAIKFAADVAGGGGVDIWSQEFPRSIFDAEWNKKKNFEAYPGEEDQAVKHLVDDRTGRVIQEIRMNQELTVPKWLRNKKDEYMDYEGNVVDRIHRVPIWNKEEQLFETMPMKFEDFKDEAREMEAEEFEKTGKKIKITTHEAFYKATLNAQIGIARGWELTYAKGVDEAMNELKRFNGYKEDPSSIPKDPATGERRYTENQIEDNLFKIKRELEASKEQSTSQRMQAKDLENQRDHVKTLDSYAKKRSFESYAKMGIFAMDETQARNTSRPLYIGPELGWPGQYGGHPEEFIELIQTSRKEMVDTLVNERGMRPDEAKELSKKHIKGLFDTGHLGMWLNNFRRKEGETEEKRLKKFNKWFMDQVDNMGKAGVVGSIQAVDSASGAHGHLPPGQGILPVKDAVIRLREKWNFTGFIVSEGHEEEQFGQNRILTQTWKEFGSPIASSGYPLETPIPQWPMIQSAYFRHTYPPNFIVGAYAPSNEWKLWTETPLE